MHGLNCEPCLLCVCISVCECAFHSLTLLFTQFSQFTQFTQFSCSSVAVKNISLTVTYIAILATTRTVPVHASSPQAGPSDSPANPELRELQPLFKTFLLECFM